MGLLTVGNVPIQLPGRAQSTLLNQIHHCDLFTLCDWLYEAGIRVDMILCDLPYGTTACSWDEVIAFEPMWQRFKRVIKPRGAIVLTASQPFTSRLVCSNLEMFKYEWVWEKSMATFFQHAKNAPMRRHENILIFSSGVINHHSLTDNRMEYFPQMEIGEKYRKKAVSPNVRGASMHHASKVNLEWVGSVKINPGERYPQSCLHFSSGNHDTLHPTQKPVALFEYLIRTYTRAGELVLDPCVGSGTTALAARNTQRQYVCGDSSAKYVNVARHRLAAPYTLPIFDDLAQGKPMFGEVGKMLTTPLFAEPTP
jgi:site-specific DNA-methyltransferase (adenine-specific)